MKSFLDTICPRCGAKESMNGLSLEEARIIASSHVCVDGVHTPSSEPSWRIVPGPGERTKLPEEKYRP